VFEGTTFTYEDDRFDYDERRYVTLGFLSDVALSIVHTETPAQIHLISMRKVTKREEIILFESIKD